MLKKLINRSGPWRIRGPEFNYDFDADLMKIKIDCNEPSYSRNLVKDIVIERGCYSNLITGLQLRGFSEMNSRLEGFKMVVGLVFVERNVLLALPDQHQRARILNAILTWIEKKKLNSRKLFNPESFKEPKKRGRRPRHGKTEKPEFKRSESEQHE